MIQINHLLALVSLLCCYHWLGILCLFNLVTRYRLIGIILFYLSKTFALETVHKFRKVYEGEVESLILTENMGNYQFFPNLYYLLLAVFTMKAALLKYHVVYYSMQIQGVYKLFKWLQFSIIHLSKYCFCKFYLSI